jgi:hypothetical protein
MALDDQGKAPFDFQRVMSRSTGLIARNFAPFFLLSIVFAAIPDAAIKFYLPWWASDDASGEGFILLGVIVVSMILDLLLQATLTRASVDDLAGRKVSLRETLSAGLDVAFPLVGLALLVSLGVLAASALLIVPGVVLAVYWFVAVPALVVERTSAISALRRSVELTRGHRWPVFGVLMVVFLLIVAHIALALELAGSWDEPPPDWTIVAMALVRAVSSMIGTVIVCATYFELRQIKEGIGIPEIASVFD